MDKKRIALIILFLLSVFVFTYLLYYFFFRSETEFGPDGQQLTNGRLPVPIPGNISVVGTDNVNLGLPRSISDAIDPGAPTEIAKGGLTNVLNITQMPAQDLVAGVGDAQFYDPQSGLFLKIDQNGLSALTDKKFFNVEKVTWHKGQDRAILEYPDGSNVFYDFKANKQITLPKELTDFSFGTTGNEYAAKWIGEKNDGNWLVVGDVTGAKFRLIEPMGDRGHNVQVDRSPDNQMIAMVRRPADANTQTILPIGQHGENFASFTVDGLRFESKWAPAGNTLLYNVSTRKNNMNPELWLTTGDTETLGTSHLNLKLNTWAHKCVFNAAGTSIYCAEPTSLPRGSGLYPELARYIPDNFYRIDLRSGQKIPLAVPVGSKSSYSAASVFLSGDESLLYFLDDRTRNIEAIRLR